MACEECERLWRAYEDSVFEHVRLCAKLKLALAGDSDGAFEDLSREVIRAENKRARNRSALLSHETAAGHGVPLSANPAV